MNKGPHPVKFQGLTQADHRPKVKHLTLLGLWKKARDQGHRDLAEMTDPLQDFFPVHERHRGIKEDKIVIMILDLPEPFFAVQGEIHLVAFLLEGLAKLLTDHFFIIDDQ